MSEVVMMTIDAADGLHRVLIVRRSDGGFTYRRQDRQANGWSAPGIDAGIYDSADSAETEARQRVPWLTAMFH